MNKRLIGMFIGLALAVCVIVSCCVMFLVGEVSVETTSELTLDAQTKTDLIDQSNIKKGMSIFSIDEYACSLNIEKQNPYLKVVAIERSFPNKVTILISSRQDLIAIPLATPSQEYSYAIVDRELKILTLSNSEGIKSLTVVDSGFSVNADEESVGSFITEHSDWLINIVTAGEKNYFVGSKFNSFIKKISYSNTDILLTTNTGVCLILKNTQDIQTHFNMAYAFYSQADQAKQSSGYILLSDNGWIWSATMIA